MSTLFKAVPKPVLRFFVKAFLLFLVWKVVYLFVLAPSEWADRPLTRLISEGTTVVLNLLKGSGPSYTTREGRAPAVVEGRTEEWFTMNIYRGSDLTLQIANVCNGLELMVLYWGFLVCFPATARLRWLYALEGLVLIPAMNIVRCVFLVLIYVYRRIYFDFSHHFVFTFLIYAVIFLLWYRFTKKATVHEAQG